MSSAFLHPAFDSRTPSPHLSYQDSAYVKDAASDLMGGLIPFASTERPLSAALLRQQIESRAASLSQLETTDFLGDSPFLSPDTLSSTGNSSFGSEVVTEVDDSFINQISCFPHLPSMHFGTPNCLPPASPSLSQPFGTLPQFSIDSASTFLGVETSLFEDYKNQHDQLPDDWKRVESFGMVTIDGHLFRVIDISGWEPPEDDPSPFVDVDLSNWIPPPSKVLPAVPDPEKGKASISAKSETKVFSSSDSSSIIRRAKKSKVWARRPKSSVATTRPQKKRRVNPVLPTQVDAAMEEATLPEQDLFKRETVGESSTGSNDNSALSEGNTQTPTEPTEKDAAGKKPNSAPPILVPDYVYPQPDIARAITQRAAEDERERALAVNLRLQEEAVEHDVDAGSNEEARQLMDEYLIFPEDEDAKESGGNLEVTNDKSLAQAFDPSALPSPVTATSVGINQGLRRTRSLLDYSASTRRRALVRSRSDPTARAVETSSQKNTVVEAASENTNTEAAQSVRLGSRERSFNFGTNGLDTFPPSRFLNDENSNAHLSTSAAIKA